MTTNTYYAKLDCLSSTADYNQTAGEVYKTCMDFLTYLSSSNLVTLISWNSGSSASAGSFTSRTYPGGALPFGDGAHSLWRFNTSSLRHWEWYLYLQNVTGPFGVGLRQAFNTPISGYGGDSFLQGSGVGAWERGILMQAALCVSGTSSFNPWNGSISDGSGNASTAAGNGTIRWISGSNNRQLYVLPRSNNVEGTHASTRDNGIALFRIYPETSVRYHFIYDGDCLQMMYDNSANSTYTISQVGGFEFRNELSGSGFCGSNFGFTMYSNPTVVTDTLSFATSFGNTTGNATLNGGLAVPFISGSKSGIFDILGTFPGSTYQPNTTINRFEEFPLYLGGAEAPFVGIAGNINTGLLKAMRDVQVHDTTADFSRAVFGGTTTVTDLKVSTPWTGSSPPGTGLSRTGSNYTWVADYR